MLPPVSAWLSGAVEAEWKLCGGRKGQQHRALRVQHKGMCILFHWYWRMVSNDSKLQSWKFHASLQIAAVTWINSGSFSSSRRKSVQKRNFTICIARTCTFSVHSVQMFLWKFLPLMLHLRAGLRLSAFKISGYLPMTKYPHGRNKRMTCHL